MLKPEEIARRLESAKKVKPWVEIRMDRLTAFGSSTRVIRQYLLGYDERGKLATDQNATWMLRAKGIERLSKLEEPELVRLGEALSPGYPEAFRAAWKLHERLPYPQGFARKPFRAPGRPDLLIKTRRAFLVSLLTSLEGFDQDLVWLAGARPSHRSVRKQRTDRDSARRRD